MSDDQWRPPPPPQYGQQPPPPPQYGPPPQQYGQQPQYWQQPHYVQQHGQGLPHGIGWGPPPQPPKKKRNGGLIALVVGGLVVLAVVGITLLSNLLKHDNSSYSSPYPTAPTSATSSPTEEPSAAPSPTKAASSQPPTSRPTASKTVVKPTAPRSTKTVKPPPKGPTELEIVSKNSLYRVGGMGSVNCKESKSRPSSAAGARANYNQLRACLGRAWPSLVQKSGHKFRPPTVLTFSGTVNSPCGSASDSGPPFYCSSNETIYMNLTEDTGNYNRHSENYQKVWARMWMMHQFAHEYGHHVQHLTGILEANSTMRYEASSQALQLEGSRRLELQASCFGDIFIGANRRSYPVTGEALFQWKWLILHWTDYGNDHGDGVNHQYWAQRGFNSRNPSVCNTFVASSARVK